MLDKLRGADFLPNLNTIFRVRLDGFEPIDLELAQVNELGPGSMSGVRTPFSLLFLGPVSTQYLLQHTYRLEHEHMGVMDLFIVPLGLEKGRMRYEAIFT